MRRVIVILALVLLAGCAPAAAPRSTQTPAPTATVAPTRPPAGSGVISGEVLFQTMQPAAGFACTTCHYASSPGRLIGPGLQGLAGRIAEYGLEQSTEEYLRSAILDPDAFLVPAEPAYPSGVMPHNYGEIFSEAELNDLIQYLLTL